MTTWVALIRGINLAGKNTLPMAGLVSELERLKFSKIKTYIQSGNVIFRGPKSKPTTVSEKISDAIKSSCGFRPAVVVFEKQEFLDAVAGNPFAKDAEAGGGKLLHVIFFETLPQKISDDLLSAVSRPGERWEIDGRIFYLYAPDGFGKSKLPSRLERLAGVQSTARNWRTVAAILALLSEESED